MTFFFKFFFISPVTLTSLVAWACSFGSCRWIKIVVLLESLDPCVRYETPARRGEEKRREETVEGSGLRAQRIKEVRGIRALLDFSNVREHAKSRVQKGKERKGARLRLRLRPTAPRGLPVYLSSVRAQSESARFKIHHAYALPRARPVDRCQNTCVNKLCVGLYSD